ncbi:hypothetical protein BaRGS_00000408 [Batillaria attramentaria]|uniref:Beta-glucosidase n=1 Tax=Batillaria attramentaria TaxID=370345 RepID=A0ABD0M8M9_9CAEN
MSPFRELPCLLRCFQAVAVLLVGVDAANPHTDDFYYGVLPENFTWGVSTSAYQIEGAWNEGGKSEHIWDRFCHEGGHVDMNHTGDVACDSYHKWHDDVTILKEMGVKHYRFSIAWSRLIPDPTTGVVNPAAVAYYLSLLTALREERIQPMVTLFHWDLPQQYADAAFSRFGGLVKYWITFNEPWVITWQGYGRGDYAPGIKQPATLPYLYGHNIIKCHAEAYHLYDTKYRSLFNGMISITLNTDFFSPKDPDNPAHVEAAERAQEFMLGWFANPIYKDGDYPQVMKDYVRRNSPRGSSRLPEFTEQEKHFIQVTQGYIGDMEVKLSRDPSWRKSASYYLFYVPWGMRGILNWIRTHYNNPPTIVTENGVTDNNGTLQDSHRIDYLRSYIDEMIKATLIDKCNVVGYTVWSIMDNFEWARGYTEKFGIYYVDFDDPQRPRVAKDSAHFYKQVIADRGFPDPGLVG